MISFKQYLERKEIDLYHGTTTGDSGERISSFSKGIVPHSSHGFNQGSGYYAFSDENKARQQANSLLNLQSKPMTGSDNVTGKQHGGKPMVVSHKARLNPRDYDLDKEVEVSDIFNFLISNINFINKILKNNNVVMPPTSTSMVETKLYEIFDIVEGKFKGSIGFWIKDPKTVDINNAQRDEDYILYTPRGNIYNAEELNVILNELFKASSELNVNYKRFVRSIMKKSDKIHRAWKYVGDKNLPVSQISVRNGDKWKREL